MLQNHIVGISGQQGCGKTTVLTWLGYIAYRNNMKIYSNYYVNYNGNKEIRDYFPISHLADIKEMKGGPNGGVWLADELYMWLSARSSQSEVNRELGEILMHARKRGISVFYTSHHRMHVDVMLRRVTNIWIIPCMLPKMQLDNNKINEIAKKRDMDPVIVKRYYRKQLKADPVYWMIHCDKYNALDRPIGTLQIRNLPPIFKMFDTTEEVNPLDTNGKPEYIHEKGMELELRVEKEASAVFNVERIPHSGRGSDTHADHYFYPKCDLNIKYYVDACGVYKNRLIKTGLDTKALLHESKQDNEYKTYAIIVFPYKDNELWYLDIKPDAYYLDYKSPITIWEDLMPHIHPFSNLLSKYEVNYSNGESKENKVAI